MHKCLKILSKSKQKQQQKQQQQRRQHNRYAHLEQVGQSLLNVVLWVLAQRPVHDGNDADAQKTVLKDEGEEVGCQCVKDGTVAGAVWIIWSFVLNYWIYFSIF